MPIFQIKESPLALIGKLVVFVALGAGSVVGAALIALILYELTMSPFAPFSSRTRPPIEYLAQIENQVPQVQNQVPQESPPAPPAPFFDYMLVLDAPHEAIRIILGQDYIHINPVVETSSDLDYVYGINIEVDKNDYPKLFEKGIGVNFNGVITYEDKLNDKFFLILANLKHDRFYYSYDYVIILDPETGKVVYEADYLTLVSSLNLYKTDRAGVLEIYGWTYHYGYVFEARLEVMEFISYDPAKGKFVPVNREFKEEFEELLARYIEIEERGCLYLGEDRPFEVIRQMGGDEARCESELCEEVRRWMGDEARCESEPSPAFITMGEYYARRQRIEDIIEGKAESMVP